MTLDALERDGQVLFRYVHEDGTTAGRDRRPGQPQRLAAGDRGRPEQAPATSPA